MNVVAVIILQGCTPRCPCKTFFLSRNSFLSQATNCYLIPTEWLIVRCNAIHVILSNNPAFVIFGNNWGHHTLNGSNAIWIRNQLVIFSHVTPEVHRLTCNGGSGCKSKEKSGERHNVVLEVHVCGLMFEGGGSTWLRSFVWRDFESLMSCEKNDIEREDILKWIMDCVIHRAIWVKC